MIFYCIFTLCFILEITNSFNLVSKSSRNYVSSSTLWNRQLKSISGRSTTTMNSNKIYKRNLSLQMSVSNNEANKLISVLDKLTGYFPLWVVSASVLGTLRPELLMWFAEYVTPALALTMIGMGMTLKTSDFSRISNNKLQLLIGICCQYSIMPLVAYTSAKLFGLEKNIASGLILVGTAPGGTASNLCSLLAQADTALSVLMTTISTLMAIFMTPFLTSQLAGGLVQINTIDLVISTLQVVLIPVILGLSINSTVPKVAAKISNYTPFCSVLLVALICGSISAKNSAAQVLSSSVTTIGTASLPMLPIRKIILAVTTLHATGFALGYLFPKLMGSDEPVCRTISIETGMQNSALAAVLASSFPNPTLTALPAVLSATVHSVIGSFLAAIWRKKKNEK